MQTKKCPNCQEEMYYNTYYHCYECGECGKVYNAVLQELAPIDDWKDEYEEDY